MAGFFDRLRTPEPTRAELDQYGGQLDQSEYQVVLDLVLSGRKINAIKNVREYTGLGLAEAKFLVDAIDEGRWAPTATAGDHSLADRVRELLAQDRVADAVVTVARETGMTQDEASRFIGSLDR